MIDIGCGHPILVIPGIQGRWEWMRPAIDVLATTNRVLSFSLSDVPSDAACFNRWDAHIDELLDAAGIEQVTLVGVSFGGVVASRYASRHPSRVARLVLVSTPGPDFQIGRRVAAYLRHPALSFPAFAIRAVGHLIPEVIASQPTWSGRLGFLAQHLIRTLRFPANPRKMAAWTMVWKGGGGSEVPGFRGSAISTPTLVITGEPVLDRVVPVASTLEYLNVIPRSRHVVLRRTGHLGIVSTPEAFARVVGEFLSEPDLHGPSRID